MTKASSQSLRADLALAGVTVVWGATFVVVKGALAEVSTFLFIALRFTVAAIALALFYGSAVRRKGLVPAALAGALLFLAYVFQTAGLETTTPSKSAFLTGLSIPLVPLASSLVYRNRPRILEIAGILTASIGMALMTLPSGRFWISRGDFLSLVCAAAFALHIVVVGHYSSLIGFKTLAVVQVASAAALGLATFRFAEPVRFQPTGAVAAAVLITGLFATAFAFGTQAWAQQYTSATRAALIFALEPVVAWATSYVLTGERLSSRGILGAVLILAGILLVELKRTKANVHLTVRAD